MGRSIKEIATELERLMKEQIESLRAETFGGRSQEERDEEKERLKRMRELSADYLAALKKPKTQKTTQYIPDKPEDV